MGDLRRIPGVGKNIEQDLPEELYRLDCLYKGFQEDRCQLYVFRLAVYYAEQTVHEPEKLKWWYWKDKTYPEAP